MIIRKEESKSARSVLLEDFNDIDVYVEDTAIESKKIYKEILNRVFRDQYSIEDVIPIGSSSKVIAEWAKHKKVADNRSKVFIIDGDFIHFNKNICDLVPKEYENDHAGLYILPRYCIENYLIDENAIIEIIHDEDPLDERNDIRRKVDFQGWLTSNQDLLIDLFIVYSICIENNVPVKTISFKVSNLANSDDGCVNNNLVFQRIEYLKEQITTKNAAININEEIEKRNNDIVRDGNTLLKFVTGKNYLFPLIKKRINSIYNLSISQISFKIRLAKKCDLSELSNLSDKIF